jgi:hypothetical protein
MKGSERRDSIIFGSAATGSRVGFGWILKLAQRAHSRLTQHLR